MKIAVISDFHLGAKEGTRREDDSYKQAKEAFEKALDLGAQLILIPGDIFNSRVPKQEVWSKTLKILSIASERENSGVKLAETVGKEKGEISALPLRGTPVVAIHGNHERRGRGFVDAIEALESAGLLIRLHHNTVVLDTPEGKVAIHGMGYVPGKYARDFLREWNPKPVKGAKNIFMMHQGLGRYVFSSDESSALDQPDLQRGFDLYISGHVHYKIESEVFDKPLIFPGSTVRTQLLPVEAETPKGFYMIELEGDELDYEFIEISSARDFFYEEKEFDGATPLEVEEWIREKLGELSGRPRKNEERHPLVRFRLTGTLAKSSSRSEIEVSKLESEFEDEFLFYINREDLTSPELEEKTQLLRDVREEKISMEEKGLQILESTLDEMDYDERFDVTVLYNLLSEEKVDEAYEEVSKEIERRTERILEERD